MRLTASAKEMCADLESADFFLIAFATLFQTQLFMLPKSFVIFANFFLVSCFLETVFSE